MEPRGDDGCPGSIFLRALYLVKNNPNMTQAVTAIVAITAPAIAPLLGPVEFGLWFMVLEQEFVDGDTVPLALITVDVWPPDTKAKLLVYDEETDSGSEHTDVVSVESCAGEVLEAVVDDTAMDGDAGVASIAAVRKTYQNEVYMMVRSGTRFRKDVLLWALLEVAEMVITGDELQ
jgi:hypothetical protein